MTKSMKMQLKHTAKTSNETNMKTTSKFGQTSTANPTLCLGIHAQAESKVVYSSTRVKLPKQEQPAERNRQLQRKLYWCPLLRLQCPSWSEMEMIGLICFQMPQSWLVELRNFATRSFMRTWKPCLWGANSTMRKLTPDPSLSAFQCTPTTQVSWSVPSVCENMWDHVRPQCCNGAVWSVFTNASFTKDCESTMPQRVFTLFPFLQCTPISLDKLQSFWTDTHLDSVSWEQWW